MATYHKIINWPKTTVKTQQKSIPWALRWSRLPSWYWLGIARLLNSAIDQSELSIQTSHVINIYNDRCASCNDRQARDAQTSCLISWAGAASAMLKEYFFVVFSLLFWVNFVSIYYFLVGSHVISGIMYVWAVIVDDNSPSAWLTTSAVPRCFNQACGELSINNDRPDIHYPLRTSWFINTSLNLFLFFVVKKYFVLALLMCVLLPSVIHAQCSGGNYPGKTQQNCHLPAIQLLYICMKTTTTKFIV